MERQVTAESEKPAQVISVEATAVLEEAARERPVACRCGRKVLHLEKKVRRLEESLAEREALIASLRAKNRQTKAELIEFQLQKLQNTLSEKDSSLATMELKLKQSSSGSGSSSSEMRQLLKSVKSLQVERNMLTRQFKNKVSERFALMRKDSEEILRAVAREYGNCSRDQLCDELRSLDVTISKLKSFIDQLLAVALESNPSLLEGLPRIQQNSGLKIELFSVASLTELLEELHEREENCQNLHHYASQLMQKLVEQAPSLLDSVTLRPEWEELRRYERLLAAASPPLSSGDHAFRNCTGETTEEARDSASASQWEGLAASNDMLTNVSS